MNAAGQGKGRRLLRKLSARLPSASANIRIPFTVLLVLVAAIFLFFGGLDSALMRAWSVCMISGAALQAFGDLLLHRGRWVVGDIARIFGFAAMNLGMVMLIAWLWASGDEAWFWYSILVYGTLIIFLLGWNSRSLRGGPRVR